MVPHDHVQADLYGRLPVRVLVLMGVLLAGCAEAHPAPAIAHECLALGPYGYSLGSGRTVVRFENASGVTLHVGVFQWHESPNTGVAVDELEVFDGVVPDGTSIRATTEGMLGGSASSVVWCPADVMPTRVGCKE